jgi:hypothetical protein
MRGKFSGPIAALMFAAGCRPDVEAIRNLAEREGGFSISQFLSPRSVSAGEASTDSIAAQLSLEMLSNGLTFDLVGLAPGAAAEGAPCVHGDALAGIAGLEAVNLRFGPHLSGGHAMMPLIRSLAWIAAMLSALDGAAAVAWHPARRWCGQDFFRDSVFRWINGGGFPVLALTSLAATSDGGMQSEGLALFTGQELRIEPELAVNSVKAEKTATWLVEHLAEAGRVEAAQRLESPGGLFLRLEPSANGRFVRVWRG